MKKPDLDREKFGEFMRRAFLIFIAVMFIGTALVGGLFYLWEATRQTDQDQAQSESQLQGKPLPDFEPVDKVDSLQKIDQQVGTGKEAKPSSTVTVVYTGAVASTGIVFESSADSGQPATFKLDQVIKGWTEGLPGMKEGGQRRLLIPASLAYGANPPPGSVIPPNADLVFDITLLAVE